MTKSALFSTARFFLCFCHVHHSEDVFLHLEPDIETGKGQTIDTVGLSLVGGTGVMAQDGHGGIPLVGGESVEQVFREFL